MLISQYSTQFLPVNHNSLIDSLNFLSDNNSNLIKNLAWNNLLRFVFWFLWFRRELNLTCFSLMNLIKLSTLSILYFKKSQISYHLPSFSRILSDLMNQIFIFIIHDCSKSSHLRSQVLSIVIVYKKVIKRLLIYIFFLWSLAEEKKIKQFYWILHFYLVLRVVMHSIDSSNSLRIIKMLQNIVLNYLHLPVWCQLGILCVMTYI